VATSMTPKRSLTSSSTSSTSIVNLTNNPPAMHMSKAVHFAFGEESESETEYCGDSVFSLRSSSVSSTKNESSPSVSSTKNESSSSITDVTLMNTSMSVCVSRADVGVPNEESEKRYRLTLPVFRFATRLRELECVEHLRTGIQCSVYCDGTRLREVVLTLACARPVPCLLLKTVGVSSVLCLEIDCNRDVQTSVASIRFLVDANAPLLRDGTPVWRLKNFVVVPVLDRVFDPVFVFATEVQKDLCVKCVLLVQSFLSMSTN